MLKVQLLRFLHSFEKFANLVRLQVCHTVPYFRVVVNKTASTPLYNFVFFFCVCRFLLQNDSGTFLFSLFSFSLTLSVLPFSGSIKTEKSQKIFFPSRKLFRRKKTFVHPLELWRNFICGNETGSPGRAVSLG